jgi:hypothetical protein
VRREDGRINGPAKLAAVTCCPVAIDLSRDQGADLRWLRWVKRPIAAFVSLIAGHSAAISGHGRVPGAGYGTRSLSQSRTVWATSRQP